MCIGKQTVNAPCKVDANVAAGCVRAGAGTSDTDVPAVGAGKCAASTAWSEGVVGGAGTSDTDVPAVGAGKCAASTAWSEGVVGGAGTRKIRMATAWSEYMYNNLQASSFSFPLGQGIDAAQVASAMRRKV